MNRDEREEGIRQRLAILWFAISDDGLLREILENSPEWPGSIEVDRKAFQDIAALIKHDDAFPLAMWVMRRLVKSFCTLPPCKFKHDCFPSIVAALGKGCVEVEGSDPQKQ